jgi:hypothetical protein
MNFDLKRPCSDCVFRKHGAIHLHPERRPGIIAHLLGDDHRWFRCHQKRGAQCVGSMVYLQKCGRPSVSMRMAYATGLLDWYRVHELFADVIEPNHESDAPAAGC